MIHLHREARLLRWGCGGSQWMSRGLYTPGALLLPAGPRLYPSLQIQTGWRRWSRIWSFQTSIQPCLMTRWTHHRSHLTEAMEHSIAQWNLRGFQANYEELVLLSKQYKPAVIALQETLLTNSKLLTFSGFNILNKNSLNNKATRGGVCVCVYVGGRGGGG